MLITMHCTVCGLEGFTEEAFEVFEEMKRAGMAPASSWQY
jgi:pentatricopeptide repeat protein